jgi:hypothetical protein
MAPAGDRLTPPSFDGSGITCEGKLADGIRFLNEEVVEQFGRPYDTGAPRRSPRLLRCRLGNSLGVCEFARVIFVFGDFFCTALSRRPLGCETSPSGGEEPKISVKSMQHRYSQLACAIGIGTMLWARIGGLIVQNRLASSSGIPGVCSSHRAS